MHKAALTVVTSAMVTLLFSGKEAGICRFNFGASDASRHNNSCDHTPISKVINNKTRTPLTNTIWPGLCSSSQWTPTHGKRQEADYKPTINFFDTHLPHQCASTLMETWLPVNHLVMGKELELEHQLIFHLSCKRGRGGVNQAAYRFWLLLLRSFPSFYLNSVWRVDGQSKDGLNM